MHPESGTTVQWLSSATSGGNYSAISGATASTYTPVIDDIGMYIKFQVSPHSTVAQGIFATSSASGPVILATPNISSISSGSPSTTNATVTWTTDIASDSQVEYGLTSSYTASTTLDSTLVTSHSVFLSGLTPNTTYHFDAISSNGNSATSTDQTFTTSAISVNSGGGGNGPVSIVQTSTNSGLSTNSNSPSITFLTSTLNILKAELQSLLAQALAQGITVSIPSSQTTTISNSTGHGYVFTKNLKLGDIDPDVKLLQQFLNQHGFLVAQGGPGSLGNEITKYGVGTYTAVSKFQKAYAVQILTPLHLSNPNGYFGASTRNEVNLLEQQ